MTCTYAIDFSSLLRKSVCEGHKGLQTHFVSLALLLPYLLHIVFLLKAINLCWYLYQVSMLYKMNVPEHNKDLLFHSYTYFNFQRYLCFRAFTQVKNYLRKKLKRSFHVLPPKGKCTYSKWNWNASLGINGGQWTVVRFFCLFSKYLKLQMRMSTSTLCFLPLDAVAKCCFKILFFFLITFEVVTDQITLIVQFDCPLLLVAHFPFSCVYDDSAKCSYPLY